MSKTKLKTWKEGRKSLNFTPEEEEQIRFEKELIEATIRARQEANLTQQELSEKSGIKQPAIAKLETQHRIPQTTTLIKLLYPLGYTLSIVQIKDKIKSKK